MELVLSYANGFTQYTLLGSLFTLNSSRVSPREAAAKVSPRKDVCTVHTHLAPPASSLKGTLLVVLE